MCALQPGRAGFEAKNKKCFTQNTARKNWQACWADRQTLMQYSRLANVLRKGPVLKQASENLYNLGTAKYGKVNFFCALNLSYERKIQNGHAGIDSL